MSTGICTKVQEQSCKFEMCGISTHWLWVNPMYVTCEDVLDHLIYILSTNFLYVFDATFIAICQASHLWVHHHQQSFFTKNLEASIMLCLLCEIGWRSIQIYIFKSRYKNLKALVNVLKNKEWKCLSQYVTWKKASKKISPPRKFCQCLSKTLYQIHWQCGNTSWTFGFWFREH